MKISQIYNLNKSQAELDFVDIDILCDMRLFIDPFFLSRRQDRWSVETSLTVRSFFQQVVDFIRVGDELHAKELFQYLHEPNVTCLGMSTGAPKGKGVGFGDTNKIYDSLVRSRAIQTGLIQDIEDNVLFVENFAKDKLSDMTTNIITRHLIEYTKSQCLLHDIPLTQNVSSGFYWDRNLNQWHEERTEMLLVNDRIILLVPKGIVSFCKKYIAEKYYNNYVLEFLQNDHINLGSILVERRADGTPFVTKKSLKEQYPISKDFLRRFTSEHPQVLQEFKRSTEENSLTNVDIENINIELIKQTLISQLRDIPSGTQNATEFHKLIIGIIEMLFYPNLINPFKEDRIHDGRKRIDITYDNAATSGIFNRLSINFRIPCPYIFIECKNYSSDIRNPELDQISGRFSINRGQVGFIVCIEIDDFPLFIKRCQDTYRDGRGLVIPLVDEDLILLMENYADWNNEFTEKFLSKRIRDITMV